MLADAAGAVEDRPALLDDDRQRDHDPEGQREHEQDGSDDDVRDARDSRHALLVRQRVDHEQRHAGAVLDAQALVELLEQARNDAHGQVELATARCDQRESRIGRVRVGEHDRGHVMGGDDGLERIEVAEQAGLVRVVDAADDLRCAPHARARARAHRRR